MLVLDILAKISSFDEVLVVEARVGCLGHLEAGARLSTFAAPSTCPTPLRGIVLLAASKEGLVLVVLQVASVHNL